METPTLREMLDSGVHFGHKTSRWHPKMEKFIFTSKSGVHVINLEKTQEELKKALEFVKNEALAGKTFVFVGTKKQAGEIVREAAMSCGMPYVNNRWLGGTITNFEAIKSAVRNFKKLRDEVETNSEKMNKSELAKARKEVARGEKFLGGLTVMDKKPEVLLLFGAYDEKNALKEAKSADLKLVGLVDTNSDPNLVDFPIPANDDATKSIKLFAELFAKVIKEASASKKVEGTKKEETK